MEFPDTERSFIELLEAVGYETVLHLPVDMNQRLPLIHVVGLPSSAQVEPFLRTDRLQVDIYAVGRTQARDIAEDAQSRLAGPTQTTEGFLDDIYPEILPYESPYTSDSTNLFTAIYRVETRPKR